MNNCPTCGQRLPKPMMSRQFPKEPLEPISILGSRLDSPEGRDLARKCQAQADKGDLERFKRGELLEGEILVGQIFEWEPFKSHAAETCEVIKITDDKILTKSYDRHWEMGRFIDGNNGEYWNDLSRFREAVVRSRRLGLDHPVRVSPHFNPLTERSVKPLLVADLL